MIKVGGIIGIDDTGMPGINRVVRYLLNYPNLEMIGAAKKQKTLKAKIRDLFLFKIFGIVKYLLPRKY